MKNVELDIEKMQFKTNVSITETYKELAEHYKGNHELLSVTFPIMVLPESSSIHKKRFIAKENELYFYTNYPWTYIVNYDGQGDISETDQT